MANEAIEEKYERNQLGHQFMCGNNLVKHKTLS